MLRRLPSPRRRQRSRSARRLRPLRKRLLLTSVQRQRRRSRPPQRRFAPRTSRKPPPLKRWLKRWSCRCASAARGQRACAPPFHSAHLQAEASERQERLRAAEAAGAESAAALEAARAEVAAAKAELEARLGALAATEAELASKSQVRMGAQGAMCPTCASTDPRPPMQALEVLEAAARVEAAADVAAREAQWSQLRSRSREVEDSQRQVDEQVRNAAATF